jgi:hypothetical protein
MLNLKQTFNVFVAIHFFLNGLLPVYVPVFLIQHGYGLAWVLGFISVCAIGFLVALQVWKKWYFRNGLKPIVAVSFAAQVALICSLVFFDHVVWLMMSALLYGGVNCFLWTSQRVLFAALLSSSAEPATDSSKSVEPTGKLLGNLQMLAAVAIKLGLLVGAFLLAQELFIVLVGLAIVVVIIGIAVFARGVPNAMLYASKLSPNSENVNLSGRRMLAYRDNHYSSLMFYIDGVFLFAESFFWVLSLYFLSQQNIQQLSFLLVALSMILGLVFWLVKNHIDHSNPQKVYVAAVLGYMISWGLRAEANVEMSPYLMHFVILSVAFLTAFFRLSFNKRLFDNAQSGSPLTYLMAKTYGSQMGVIVAFGVLAASVYYHWFTLQLDTQSLNDLYWPLAMLSGLYLLYQLKAKPNNGCLIST